MKIRGIVIFVAIFLLSLLPVLAGSSIGVSPPSQSFFMMPGESTTGELRVIYSEPYPSVASVFATRDLADIVTIENPEIEIPAGGPAPKVRYTITIPQDTGGKFGFGGDIRIELKPPADKYRQGGGTGAFAAIGSLMSVRTPTPGKYLAAKFKPVSHVNAGEIAYLTIQMRNLGTEILTGLVGSIEIYDAQGDLVTVVQTSETSLQSGQEGELYSYWETDGMPPSYYTAKFRIDYGGDNPVEGEAVFLVGDLVVNIDEVKVNNTNREVTKFEIGIESLWNAPIPNVYAELEVINATKHKAGKGKSTLENLEPRGVNTLVAYVESGHLSQGKYEATITVFYDSKTVEKIVPFEILGERLREEPRLSARLSTFFSGTNILLIILIVLLANLFIFLLLSRKYEDKKPKKPTAHVFGRSKGTREEVKKVANMEMAYVPQQVPIQQPVSAQPSQIIPEQSPSYAQPTPAPVEAQYNPEYNQNSPTPVNLQNQPLGQIQRVGTIDATLRKLDELSKK